jgi:type VI secretion system protein ImpB
VASSIHKEIGRGSRKPRVHIQYQLETEGATIVTELPFVVGVMGDFSGDPTAAKKPLRDRKFIDINKDNFDKVMALIAPQLSFKVDNVIEKDGSQFQVDLKFTSMADFEPGKIAEQVPVLKNLIATRSKLRDLMSRADRSHELESLLEEVLRTDDQREKFSNALGMTDKKPSDGKESAGQQATSGEQE